jgi:hypothetical protein
MNKNNSIQNHNIDNGLQLLTIPTRIHGFLNEKMKVAVAELNKEREQNDQLTVAHFIRLATAEKVAEVLHEEVADIPPVIRGRGGSMVAQLAKELGVSQEVFAQKAAELIAAQRFGYKGPGNELLEKIINGEVPVVGGGGNQTSSQPSRREASKSGQHQIAVSRNVTTGRTQRRTG